MGYLSELLLAKSRAKSFRLYSTAPILTVAEAAKTLPKRNALTLIHKTASLLTSTLSPAPKHPVESQNGTPGRSGEAVSYQGGMNDLGNL